MSRPCADSHVRGIRDGFSLWLSQMGGMCTSEGGSATSLDVRFFRCPEAPTFRSSGRGDFTEKTILSVPSLCLECMI